MLAELLLLAGLVYANNLLPAFGPPTWALLVFFALRDDLPLAGIVAVGAVAAASGRLTLAVVSRRLRDRFSPARRADLDALAGELEAGRARAVAGLALFALSPIPSAQLFVAAGLAGLRLVPLTLAFFAGRLVSYTIYATAATQARDQLSDVLSGGVASPWLIGLQVLLLAGLVALVRVPWARVLARSPRRSTRRPAAR